MLVMVVLATGATAEPARAAPAAPATPTDVVATNSASSISLDWSQPRTGSRPVGFRVYEGSTVVARNTTTRVTVPNLGFNGTHTYRVTAVDRAGRESAPSAPVTRRVFVGGPFACGMTAPDGLVATAVTASAVSLSWSNAVPSYDQQGTLVVLRDSVEVLQTALDSARIGGLAPATTYTFTVARRDCQGTLHPGAPVTVTTAAGDPARPAAPTGLAIGTRTATSIALSWSGTTAGATGPNTPPNTPVAPVAPGTAGTGSAAVRYAVYEGGERVATSGSTSITVAGLWRDTSHEFTVAALDAAGNESAHTAPASASTQPCPDGTAGSGVVNSPSGLTATAVSSSTVALSWVQDFEATSFTVYRIAPATSPVPVVTTLTTSAVVTGLPAGASTSYAVVAQTAACGASPLSNPVDATTPPGATARPAAPTELRVTARTPNIDFTGTVGLAWTAPAGDDPAVGFRLYEGATPLASSTAPNVELRLPGGPTHSVTVVAVDAAGNESAQSQPVVFTVPFLPPP